jgi:hypothetical protein
MNGHENMTNLMFFALRDNLRHYLCFTLLSWWLIKLLANPSVGWLRTYSIFFLIILETSKVCSTHNVMPDLALNEN